MPSSSNSGGSLAISSFCPKEQKVYWEFRNCYIEYFRITFYVPVTFVLDFKPYLVGQ